MPNHEEISLLTELPSLEDPHKSLGRREFTRLLATGAVMGAAGAFLNTKPPGALAAESKAEEGYFDIHTHLGQTWNSTQVLNAEGLLRWMDAYGIAQAAILPLVSPESSSYPLTSNFVLQQTANHRDRLIPFCSIDPRTSYQQGQKGLVSMLRRYMDAGARGFGEHKPGVAIDDVRNMALYSACGEVELPVLFHLDNQRNTDTPGLPGLERVLKEHPQTIFIGHGPGFWASISAQLSQADLGGYPRGKVVPGGALDRLMETYPNLYGDLSAGSGASAITRDMEFGRGFLQRRADRLMFGTDFLTPGQNVPQLDLYGSIELPKEVKWKIYHDNARGLLKLV